MKLFRILIIVMFTCFLSSCHDKTIIGPSTGASNAGFSIIIIVKDSIGNPVPYLRVVGGSLASIEYFFNQGVRAWVNSAYVARLTARDTADNSLKFQDSIFMVYGDVDIGNPPAWLGYTASNGELTLNDINRFPGILKLPSIPETNIDGPTPISNFSILDTAMFIFIDTVTHNQQVERSVIQNGINILHVKWTQGTENVIPMNRFSGNPNNPAKSERDKFFKIGNPTFNGESHATSLLAATVIRFDLAAVANVNLSILQPDDSIISILIDKPLSAGAYAILWNTQLQPSISNRNAFKLDQMLTPIPIVTDWKLYQNYPNPYD